MESTNTLNANPVHALYLCLCLSLPFTSKNPILRRNAHALPPNPQRDNKERKKRHDPAKDTKGDFGASVFEPRRDEKCPAESNHGAQPRHRDETVCCAGAVCFDYLGGGINQILVFQKQGRNRKETEKKVALA
jgi:hypothetical protein